jgi:molybdopterin-guanine dinucleotide biosynthesis protein A
LIATKGLADYAAKMSVPTITAIILAGGKAERMGNADKGLVIYQDKPLIKHVIESIEPQVQKIVVNYNRNETEYQNLQFPTAKDPNSDYRGPLEGILSCRHLVKSEYIFVVPCDMPHLPANVVSLLFKELHKTDLCVVHDGIRMQPLVFVGKTQLLDSIEEYLDNGGRSVHKWVSSKDHVVVDFSRAQAAFWNINEESQLN